ncbi:hypothetical protein BD324DRAFT_620289 [Kockovaella imperatae]|uniref:Nascent polypeptide-associated complex subunit alpha-like UBA domain-containing protein n=1 Tax=Kockovaella imperatae TaxID=4999 RepID=A0A1Y1UJP7_9TREE|nr:hypothetical protein BD324DRAFT_620289 [Kockovaella imperatae]ORX38290.1 hypothetical protein BD324DRAFT_620289 [Kockovaella imperatae]
MAASSSTGRVPQGEVIIDFADGGSFIKNKLDDAVLTLERRRLEREEQGKAQKAMEALKVGSGEGTVGSTAGEPKSSDVDFVVAQVGCSRAEAETALREEKDMVKALIRLVKPRQRARSVDGGAEPSKAS